MTWLLRAMRHVRWRHRHLFLPALIVVVTDVLLRTSKARRDPTRPPPPLDWGAGLSIIVPERGDATMLADCLHAATHAAAQIDEPVEMIVVVNGAAMADYESLRLRYPGIRWLHHANALGFSRAVLTGLAHARYGATYLLNSDMLLAADALHAVMQWREPRIFGIATEIFMEGRDQRREETGWTAMAFDGARPMPRHLLPRDETVRGTVWAGAGAALYNTALLKRLFPDCVIYDPFYWEDVDLGVRAWQLGYQSVCCPASKTWHGHRVTVNRYYPEDEIARIFERNRLQFLLRHPLPRRGLKQTLMALSRCDVRSARELSGLRHGINLWRTRWRAFRAPYRNIDYSAMSMRQFQRPRKPRLLLTSPFAVVPPRHGGAVRTHRLACALAHDYEIILVTDEAELYGDLSGGNADPFSAVHFVRGRPSEAHDACPRIARIRSHSHAAFADELAYLVALYQPAVVLVEHMELAALIGTAPLHGPRYILSLQDVLLCPDDPRESHADRFELALIDRFDGLVVSSEEDQRLLGSRASRLIVNGFDASLSRHYVPSAGTTILFVGPFRAPNNWEGIVAFAEHVYPELERRVRDVSLMIVGGAGALQRIDSCPALNRPSIRIVEHIGDLGDAFVHAAITINPQQSLRGSSLKVIESLAMGRVCVSTKAGARGREDDGFRGLIIVPTVADFLEPLVHLLGNENERIDLERPEPDKLASSTWEAAGEKLRAYVAAVVNATDPIDAAH